MSVKKEFMKKLHRKQCKRHWWLKLHRFESKTLKMIAGERLLPPPPAVCQGFAPPHLSKPPPKMSLLVGCLIFLGERGDMIQLHNIYPCVRLIQIMQIFVDDAVPVISPGTRSPRPARDCYCSQPCNPFSCRLSSSIGVDNTHNVPCLLLIGWLQWWRHFQYESFG